MVPVIGLVQISYYVHADRYTYLPQIGLYIMATWTASGLCSSWRHGRPVLIVGGAMIIAVLITCARIQVSYWQNTKSRPQSRRRVVPPLENHPGVRQ